MLYSGDERHAGNHIFGDYRVKVRIVRRTHPRTTADTCQQRGSKQNESDSLHVAVPTLLPFLILLPQ